MLTLTYVKSLTHQNGSEHGHIAIPYCTLYRIASSAQGFLPEPSLLRQTLVRHFVAKKVVRCSQCSQTRSVSLFTKILTEKHQEDIGPLSSKVVMREAKWLHKYLGPVQCWHLSTQKSAWKEMWRNVMPTVSEMKQA